MDKKGISEVKLVYVAGPFRAPNVWDMEQNIRRAEALSLEVWRLGAVAICPHLNTRCFQGVLPDHIWLDGDLAILTKCDAVIMTEDWQRSEGATTEHVYARKHQIPIFYDLKALKEWVFVEEHSYR